MIYATARCERCGLEEKAEIKKVRTQHSTPNCAFRNEPDTIRIELPEGWSRRWLNREMCEACNADVLEAIDGPEKQDA